ncbi:peptidylprolyl isomerase [bacterium]|nr:peptidylprolyl isomerase [bacterium]
MIVRKLLSVLIVSSIALAACSSPESVARVGDTEISMDDLAALYNDVSSLPIDESFRETLFRVIAVEALEQGYEDQFGESIDEALVEVRFVELTELIEVDGMTPADFLGVADASTEMVEFNARVIILRESATGQLVSDETIHALVDNGVAITTVCARHILVETEGEALAVIERVEAGEAFADVATEVSLDSAVGGDLECSLASRYVPEFAAASVEAPLNALAGPVETQFGFHVIEVYDRSAPTFDELRADPINLLPSTEIDGLWVAWFNETLQNADAEVLDARFGQWSPVGIVPPEG